MGCSGADRPLKPDLRVRDDAAIWDGKPNRHGRRQHARLPFPITIFPSIPACSPPHPAIHAIIINEVAWRFNSIREYGESPKKILVVRERSVRMIHKTAFVTGKAIRKGVVHSCFSRPETTCHILSVIFGTPSNILLLFCASFSLTYKTISDYFIKK